MPPKPHPVQDNISTLGRARVALHLQYLRMGLPGDQPSLTCHQSPNCTKYTKYCLTLVYIINAHGFTFRPYLTCIYHLTIQSYIQYCIALVFKLLFQSSFFILQRGHLFPKHRGFHPSFAAFLCVRGQHPLCCVLMGRDHHLWNYLSPARVFMIIIQISQPRSFP